MNEIAMHLRITGLHYDNSDVDARRAAANALRTTWSKVSTVSSIVLKAQDVANALVADVPSPALGAEVQSAVQKKASAFLHEDRPLEVGIVAGVAAQELIAGSRNDPSGWQIGDVWAMALWSALSFHPTLTDPKREALRIQIFEAARKRSIDGSEFARQRIDVPDIPDAETEGVPDPKLQAQNKSAIEALRRNSALDREELDFLWWALADRSRVLNRRLSLLNEPTRIVAAAVDASGLLRRLPCGVHRELVLRSVDADPDLDLPQLLGELGEAKGALASDFHTLASTAPMVFPVLSAMIAGNAGNSPGSAFKRKSSEWGQRVLLEAAMCRITETGPKRK